MSSWMVGILGRFLALGVMIARSAGVSMREVVHYCWIPWNSALRLTRAVTRKR